MKNYVGIVRDHSISMSRIRREALNDFNQLAESFQKNALSSGIDTVMFVAECGTHTGSGVDSFGNRMDVVNSSVQAVKPLSSYKTDGNSTPLYAAVQKLLNSMKSVPDANDPDVSFLVMVVTDGRNNAGNVTGQSLVKEMNSLIDTDRWTFTFRVPYGSKDYLARDGIKDHMILEVGMDSAVEVAASTVQTVAAVDDFYLTRSTGGKSKANFYVDTGALNTQAVKRTLSEITHNVKVMKVQGIQPKTWISKWYEDQTRLTYVLGSCYYQLTKTEKVQPQKKIIVWDKRNNRYYTGADARWMLNLPEGVETKVGPGANPQYEVFVQSTSINRHLVDKTHLLVYTG